MPSSYTQQQPCDCHDVYILHFFVLLLLAIVCCVYFVAGEFLITIGIVELIIGLLVIATNPMDSGTAGLFAAGSVFWIGVGTAKLHFVHLAPPQPAHVGAFRIARGDEEYPLATAEAEGTVELEYSMGHCRYSAAKSASF